MGRHSFKWVWAVVGVAAIAFIVISGLNRRAKLSEPAAPAPTQPIIVEPIQPSAPVQAPVVPLSPAVTPAPAPTATNPSSVSGGPTTSVSAPSVLPKESSERIKKIQRALQAAGYNPGPADGKMGRMTSKAIRDFQEAQGLSVDGKVGPKTWAKLEAYLHNATTTSASQD